ncbi:TetR/AcrR family transcriptional regulator [Marinobacter halodurans]|uniref:TetR/AcrR family transcriptional regulator n=1 Tax=Marinobacter halodurans TaxID=2528979 RepID=A0ABY1ZIV7_9GAMM|nr:TetR/AcrR family transcriptional regulator [Marinobacter halodurans]TBW54635.1 TetR/AcrR family transcriptional regulator [Marinobacter halodurans]
MIDAQSVSPRRRPLQARSRERVETILKHATLTIHDTGVDGTSMSAIARSAGMSLASLYRYFPNKSAIVKAIAERHVEKLETLLRERLASCGPETIVETLLDVYYVFYRDEPAYQAIWAGVEAMPELQALDLQELHANAADLDAYLAANCPQVAAGQRHAASMMLPRACGSLLRLAVTVPEPEAEMLVGELKRMVRAYLDTLMMAER